jgi:hypothetical protein
MKRNLTVTSPVERGSFSVDEFCARHDIGRATYNEWKKLGLRTFPGPRGERVTLDAERDILKILEEMGASDAGKLEAERRSEYLSALAKKGLESDNHPSKTNKQRAEARRAELAAPERAPRSRRDRTAKDDLERRP